MKTLKNKIVAVLMMLLACVPLILFRDEQIDGTYLLFFAMVCIPLFFDSESWFYEPKEEDSTEETDVCEWEDD